MSRWLIWRWRTWDGASSTTPGRHWPSLAERFPASRALAPTRLRLAEAALAAHQAERAAEQFRLVAGVGGKSERASPRVGRQIDRPDGTLAPNSSAWRAWGSRSGSWASQPTPPRPSRPRSIWPRPIRPRRRLRWPRLAHSRPASRSMPPSRSYSLILERFAKSGQAYQAALAQARLFAQNRPPRRGGARFRALDRRPACSRLASGSRSGSGRLVV